jgi:uncharacterized protein YrrD
MLFSTKELDGFQIIARDGEVGHVRDIYFDDRQWAIRHLVVETGDWLSRRDVLISPHSIQGIAQRKVSVALSRAQIEKETGAPRELSQRAEVEREAGDPHLRSSAEVTGYRVEASDGNIGHIDDFLFDGSSWAIRHAVVDTREWLPGGHVLIEPLSIERVDWNQHEVRVKLTREVIKSSPPYDRKVLLAR